MKILILSSTFPYPPSQGGTQVRTFNLLKYLSQNHEITLITQINHDVNQSEIEALKQWINNLVVFPLPKTSKNSFLNKLQNLANFILNGTPPNVLSRYSPEIQIWVDQKVQEKQFDLITCEHSVNEIYIRSQWREILPTVVNIHSSIYRTCLNQLETKTSDYPLRDRLYLPLLKRYEQSFCKKFSQLVVTTEEDRQQIEKFNPNSKITVIPNGVDLELFPYRKLDPGGYQLIITGGMDYIVNIDAACFFALEILPHLQRKYPETTLMIVGSKPAEIVLELTKRPGITVTGRVPSMVEYLHQATICVVPMRSGFGIKNKTLEAMAAGVPVVASDRGLEGLTVDGDNIPLRALRANKIEEYIEAIEKLFQDSQLRATLSYNARTLIEKEYTWEQSGAKYEQILISG